ncbi:MAG: hypothetical protein ACKVGZ_15335 [Alphaproteobacteria bacterium]
MNMDEQLVCVGECMLEMSERPDGSLAKAFGGDSLNTPVAARGSPTLPPWATIRSAARW